MIQLPLVDKIRDPVHGFIFLTELEKEIIDSEPFRRLRNIRQLAFTNLVYPGAEHSRFSHSLGVMEFSSRIFETLMRKDKELIESRLGWHEDYFVKYWQLIRLASLLHDIGHAPFSHASEDCFEKNYKHEDYTRIIIKSEYISKIIDEYVRQTGIRHEEVSAFFEKRSVDENISFLKPIFSGEMDSDRMDYLLRDSLFSGVGYGRFDYERLIVSLCLVELPESGNPVIAVEEGGVHALEALILARYFMFTQVYFHRVRRSLDFHLTRFVQKTIGKYPREVTDFLACDDKYVIDKMKQNPNNVDSNAILKRLYFRQAFHTEEHCRPEDVVKFLWLKEKVADKFGKENVFFDEAKNAPHKFEKNDTFVRKEKGEIVKVQSISRLISQLDIIEQYRIYAARDKREEIKKFCDNFKIRS